MKKIIKIYFLSWLIIFIPLSVQASFLNDFFEDLEKYFEEEFSDSVTTSSVRVINKVNVSATTGGNVVEEGKEATGQAEVKVKVETIINEQSIEPIDIEVKSEDEEAKVEVEQKIIVDDGQEPQVEQEIETNGQIETEDIQVSEKIEEKIEKRIEPVIEKISHWWSNFLEDLGTTLLNIFKF